MDPSLTAKKKRKRSKSHNASSNTKQITSSENLHTSSSSSFPVPTPPFRPLPPNSATSKMELTSLLQTFSAQKDSSQALSHFNYHFHQYVHSNGAMIDAYVISIMVNCCVRGGDLISAEKIVESEMKRFTDFRKSKLSEDSIKFSNGRQHSNLSTASLTSLMKGYAHSSSSSASSSTSNEHKGLTLLREMLSNKASCRYGANAYPNSRTVNTLLRGMVWGSSGCGGVKEARKLWKMLEKAEGSVSSKAGRLRDGVSIGYFVDLMLRGLRLAEIEKILEVFGDSDKDGNFNVEHETTMAKFLVGKMRVSVLLNENVEAEVEAGPAVHAKLAVLEKFWRGKEAELNTAAEGEGEFNTRDLSNIRYRAHKISVLKAELSRLTQVAFRRRVAEQEAGSDTSKRWGGRRDLFELMEKKVFVFGGGGTTELTDDTATATFSPTADVRANLRKSLVDNFGLYAGKKNVNSETNPFDGSIGDTGGFDLGAIFGSSTTNPLCVELGSGAGDWIVSQALSSPNKNFVSIEVSQRAEIRAQWRRGVHIHTATHPRVRTSLIASLGAATLRPRLRDDQQGCDCDRWNWAGWQLDELGRRWG